MKRKIPEIPIDKYTLVVSLENMGVAESVLFDIHRQQRSIISAEAFLIRPRAAKPRTMSANRQRTSGNETLQCEASERGDDAWALLLLSYVLMTTPSSTVPSVIWFSQLLETFTVLSVRLANESGLLAHDLVKMLATIKKQRICR